MKEKEEKNFDSRSSFSHETNFTETYFTETDLEEKEYNEKEFSELFNKMKDIAIDNEMELKKRNRKC